MVSVFALPHLDDNDSCVKSVMTEKKMRNNSFYTNMATIFCVHAFHACFSREHTSSGVNI